MLHVRDREHTRLELFRYVIFYMEHSRVRSEWTTFSMNECDSERVL